MKRFLLFAGNEHSRGFGANGLINDFDSAAEALVSMVDHQIPSTWWHVLDTQTGEVIDREHVRIKDGVLSFATSERIVGAKAPQKPAMPSVAAAPFGDLEHTLRTAVETSVRGNGRANGTIG
jgi:hypothetical protein